MNGKILTFIGLTPGYPPWGREPLFRILDARTVPFKQNDVITLATAAAHKIELPQEEKIAVQQAILDWGNSAPCDDNLFLTRR